MDELYESNTILDNLMRPNPYDEIYTAPEDIGFLMPEGFVCLAVSPIAEPQS